MRITASFQNYNYSYLVRSIGPSHHQTKAVEFSIYHPYYTVQFEYVLVFNINLNALLAATDALFGKDIVSRRGSKYRHV